MDLNLIKGMVAMLPNMIKLSLFAENLKNIFQNIPPYTVILFISFEFCLISYHFSDYIFPDNSSQDLSREAFQRAQHFAKYYLKIIPESRSGPYYKNLVIHTGINTFKGAYDEKYTNY